MPIERPSTSDWRRWGIEPSWHRMVPVSSATGTVTWSVLDTGPASRGTIVCVHGNPTWGYLWRDVLRELAGDWRVIAVDQTGMGWSERTGERRLAERIDELVSFCRAETDGPLILVAHDWGGPVAVGAAARLDVQALVLGNTAVAKPDAVAVPPLIATARAAVDLTCRRLPLFVRGTARMTAREHREALNAPYRSASRRRAVAMFVADIPVSPADPSHEALEGAAEALADLDRRGVPILLVWGGRDPVFHDRFLADLLLRAPHADVHRFAEAAHLVPLDVPMGEVMRHWLDQTDRSSGSQRSPDSSPPADTHGTSRPVDPRPITTALAERSGDASPAFTGPDGIRSWSALHAAASRIASNLVAAGVKPGDRVAMLVPPGAALLEAAYGAWSAGATLVVADSTLGIAALRSAIRGATPGFVLGTPRTLAAATAARLAPGARRLCLGRFPRAIDVTVARRAPQGTLPELTPEMLAAVVHTSGATGPAKPVAYTHGALAAQREVIRSAFALDPQRGFLSSFAPFILLGPALGVPCVLPEGDVTAPEELDFDRLAEACRRSDLDVAWLSPASARTIARTAAGRTVPLRLVMLAGAPIDPRLAESIRDITGAEVRAPYGMTEAMPITDGTGATTSDVGTVTGRPLPGATVEIVTFGDVEGDTLQPGDWGEILVAAPWMRRSYDRRWSTQHEAGVRRGGRQMHRTGDVGFLTTSGDLVQLGRVQHVITTADGPRPCVPIEREIGAGVARDVAAVGVGPTGTQVVVVVVDADGPLRLADRTTTSAVRSVTSVPIAAVLEGALPLDIRHHSKIRREQLAGEAAALLEGR